MKPLIDPAEVIFSVFNSMLGGMFVFLFGLGAGVALFLPLDYFEFFDLWSVCFLPVVSLGFLLASIVEIWGILLFSLLAIYFYQLIFNDGDRGLYFCLIAISTALGYKVILFPDEALFYCETIMEWCWFLGSKILITVLLLSRFVHFDWRKNADI